MARPRLARSEPPDPANRVKLLRAFEKRCGSAVPGIGGRFGGVRGSGRSIGCWSSCPGPLPCGDAGGRYPTMME